MICSFSCFYNKESKKQLKSSVKKFCKKVLHKTFAIFTGKHICWSLFLNKV